MSSEYSDRLAVLSRMARRRLSQAAEKTATALLSVGERVDPRELTDSIAAELRQQGWCGRLVLYFTAIDDGDTPGSGKPVLLWERTQKTGVADLVTCADFEVPDAWKMALPDGFEDQEVFENIRVYDGRSPRCETDLVRVTQRERDRAMALVD